MSENKKFVYHRDNFKNQYKYSIDKGQYISGYTIGILHLKVWYPLLPGNVVNANTFDFPVRYKLIPDATQLKVHRGDPSLIENIIQAGKELEVEGVRAICGACGYLGNFQKQVSSSLDVPVFLSSLLQVNMITQGLKKNEKIGVLCADKKSFKLKLLESCGISDPSKLVVSGIGERPNFSSILKSDRGYFDNEGIKKEVVNAAKELVIKNDNIGALLLECSDMPPYSSLVQQEIGLPVFDFITMINWVYSSVAQTPYCGFV